MYSIYNQNADWVFLWNLKQKLVKRNVFTFYNISTFVARKSNLVFLVLLYDVHVVQWVCVLCIWCGVCLCVCGGGGVLFVVKNGYSVYIWMTDIWFSLNQNESWGQYIYIFF